jgi:uncharacterized metal-binding protein
MARETKLECAGCQVPLFERACDNENGTGPGGCPTLTAEDALAAAAQLLEDPAVVHFARQASRQEAAGYSDHDGFPRAVLTRIEEICAFADRMGFRKLGLAFCAGLVDEAARLERVLTAHGFEVASVVCKVGRVPKESLGLLDDEKIRPGSFEPMCNPIAQAELLNRAGTELNLLLGLCVGHDALFIKNSQAYTTVAAVKDRVLGHNPLAALYTSGSYYWFLGMPDQR